MMLDDRLFEQEWVQNLSNEDFRLLTYLFFFASKSGIVELNMRMINFVSNTGRNYTKEEVLSKFGNLIQLIPGKDNTAIFPDWIYTNWSRGKPIDTVRNPLFKSIVNELSSFGLTIDDVNAMAKKKIKIKEDSNVGSNDSSDCANSNIRVNGYDGRVSKNDIGVMFQSFWESYPKSCPRRTDKKKCLAKFTMYLTKSKDAVELFNKIMNGLDLWKKCDTWTRDGGQYIMAPLRWLNNENWNDEPKGGTSNGNTKHNSTSNANYSRSDSAGIF